MQKSVLQQVFYLIDFGIYCIVADDIVALYFKEIFDMKQKLLWLVFGFSSFGFGQNMLDKLSRHNMRTLEWEDEDWPNEPYYDFLNRSLSYQENPQAAKKRRGAFQLFKKAGDTLKLSKVFKEVITWQDLQLFAGKEIDEPYLGSIMNRTQTELGYVYLLYLLANPSADRNEILQRQSIVRALVADKTLLRNLTELLEIVKQNESYILSFFLNDPLYNSADKQHYLNTPISSLNEVVNKNQWLLEGYSLAGHKTRLAQTAFMGLSTVVLPAYVAAKLTKANVPEIFEQFSLRLSGMAGADNALITLFDNKYLTLAAMSFASYYCFAATKREYEWSRDNFFLDWCLQKKLHGVSKYFTACQKIFELVPSNMLNDLVTCKQVAGILEGQDCSNDLKSLKALLGSSTFTQAPSYIANHGRVLCAYRNMRECKEELAPLFLAVAEIDAYCAIANLYNEYQDRRVHFCFAELVESDRPVMIFDELWNPFIPHDCVISNTISIDQNDAHTMILTGPNAAGKSTLVKGLAQALILAQSFGIAPAKRAVITPFDQIVTYLNITDDIGAGNSLFKSQVIRVQYIVDQATQLAEHDQKIFIAIDEMFNGTSPKEAMACAYSVAKYLGSLKNGINVIATHYPELTTLPLTSKSFENYKVSVEFASDGHIVYPYTIQKGVSDQHVAIDILKEEGLSGSIIDQARQLIGEFVKI